MLVLRIHKVLQLIMIGHATNAGGETFTLSIWAT